METNTLTFSFDAVEDGEDEQSSALIWGHITISGEKGTVRSKPSQDIHLDSCLAEFACSASDFFGDRRQKKFVFEAEPSTFMIVFERRKEKRVFIRVADREIGIVSESIMLIALQNAFRIFEERVMRRYMNSDIDFKKYNEIIREFEECYAKLLAVKL